MASLNAGHIPCLSVITDLRMVDPMRMRHLPFPIGESEANEWMRCMSESMLEVGIPDAARVFLEARFSPLADHMVNR